MFSIPYISPMMKLILLVLAVPIPMGESGIAEILQQRDSKVAATTTNIRGIVLYGVCHLKQWNEWIEKAESILPKPVVLDQKYI